MQLCSVCVCVCVCDTCTYTQYGALFWDFPLFLPTFSTLPLPLSTTYTTLISLPYIPDVLIVIHDTFSLPTFCRFYFESSRMPHRFHSYFYIPSANLFDAPSYDCWNYCFPYAFRTFHCFWRTTRSNQLFEIRLVDQFPVNFNSLYWY